MLEYSLTTFPPQEALPNAIGKLSNLEELVASQNFLRALPPSIGLCRKLHTLNVDENDLDALPKEVGSCAALKILSAHRNHLMALPAELDHISELSVLNLTGNLIQHLPVSFMKLRKVTAIWLSQNQNKPLIQLNQGCNLIHFMKSPKTSRKLSLKSNMTRKLLIFYSSANPADVGTVSFLEGFFSL